MGWAFFIFLPTPTEGWVGVKPAARGVLLMQSIGCKASQVRARSDGSVAHQITLGLHRIGILMPRVKRAGFVLEGD